MGSHTIAQYSGVNSSRRHYDIVRRNPVGSAPESSDEELIRRIAKGDNDALGVLFRRYAGLVRVVALRILRDDSEADDLVQDLFLYVHQKAAAFDRSKSTARAWIVGMTYCRSIDRQRSLQSKHFYSHVEIGDAAVALADTTSMSTMSQHDFGDIFGTQGGKRIAELLTPNQYEVLRLAIFDGYTMDEIAETMKQTYGNVRNHYYRALDTIRQRMFGMDSRLSKTGRKS